MPNSGSFASFVGPLPRAAKAAQPRYFAALMWIVLAVVALALPAQAQNRLSILPTVLDAPGGTVASGDAFRYRISYSCDLISIPTCDGAVVTVDLPPEVVFDSLFFPPTDVASGSHDGSPTGGTVTFNFQASVPAGNTGDMDVTVHFANGSTADGTPTTGVTNAVISTGTGLVTQMEDLPPVTAQASPQVDIGSGLDGGFIGDCPTGSTYNINVGPSTASGSLDLLDADVVLQLPVGVTNVMPMDGGVYDAMTNTVTWTGLGPIPVPTSLTLRVDVSFEDPPFSAGDTVTSTVTATVDPLGEPPGFVQGPTDFMHTLLQFAEVADAAVSKGFGAGRPSGLTPAEGQDFSYDVSIRNTGNIALDSLVVVDDGDGAGADLDAGISISSVSTGAYSPAPTSVTVNVTTNLANLFTVTSPNGSTDATVTPALGAGERVTRIEWVFNGGAPVGMAPSSQASIAATVNLGFPAGTNIDNHVTADWTATFTGLCGGPVGPTSGSEAASFDFDVSGPYTYLRPLKNETSTGPYFPNDTVSFSFDITNDALADDPASGLVVTDLLPDFLDFQAGSETFMDNGTGVVASLFEEIDNYNGTGRTLLRWTLVGDLDPGETVNIAFDTELMLGVIFGNLNNTVGLSFTSPVEQICAGTSATDVADLDGDADTTDTLCTENEGITVAAVAQLSSAKLVRGQCNSSGPGFIPGLATDDTTRGGVVDWRVEVQNVQTVPMEDFVIIDILPFVGDTGVRDTSGRLSLFRPLLVEPISPPPGGAVFYSLSGNPCRPEVGGPTSGCDAANWTTIAPTPITDAQSIKIEFGDLVLNPLDKLEFQWRMIAPANADPGAAGDEAFNSFAFGSSRQDDGGFLGAEPNKVGIDVTCAPVAPDDAMLGNFVWIDSDGDGMLTPGEVGVNDVPVALYGPGPDMLPRTGDDVLLLSTITSDDDMGNPGWYKFSALSPGSYYVQFTPPQNFDVTLQDVGAEGLDSDADPVTACTDVVTLGPSENNPDIDMGLLPPVTAALGNYVWFDRDGNGLQNEAATDGINGVAVKLFVDDGDGNAEPGGDDGAPLQVTVTADDEIGNPGYYLFEDLIPGVRYFVQFMLPSPATGFTGRNAGDDSIDSDARASNGTTSVVILSAGEFNPTVDAGLVLLSGDLSLGNVVWCDDDGNGVIDAAGDDDGIYDPLVPEAGINGVRINLYLDLNTDGMPQVNEFYGSTQTVTSAGRNGRYRFDGLPSGDFIVEIDASNFVSGGPFESCSALGVVSSTGNEPTPDPDNDVDNDDSGDLLGTSVVSQAITLSVDGEPTPDAEDDLEDDNNINFTLDFGFIPGFGRSFDFGDAPDAGGGTAQGNYRTVALDGGAQHELVGPMAPFLGDCVDSDDGQAQSFTAMADDLSGALTVTHGMCATAGDDEDGVTFSSTVLMLGGSVDITLDAQSPVGCLVNGWIDWNRDGDFGDAGEQVFFDISVGAVPGLTMVPVPATATPGFTYARFRCSTVGGDGPSGAAADGEVEDYRLEIAGADLGDAPDTFGTLLPGGAVHGTDPNVALYLGNCVDTEGDGQPSLGADGDDTMLGSSRIGDCVDDEDGITFNGMLVRGMTGSLTATASVPTAGLLDAWIDFNGNGVFDHPAEHLFGGVSQALSTGSNSLPSFVVPANAAVGISYARFRFSSAGGLAPTGMAMDGEVEDYQVLIKGFDFGDAPDAEYGTVLASGGAQHVVDPTGNVYLGPGASGCADVENDGAPSVGADGDDTTATLSTSADAGVCGSADDEEGVTFDTMLFTCQQAQITVTTGAAGRLDAWIDYDRAAVNGFGGVSDQIFTNRSLNSGTNVLTFDVPCNAQLGDSYARFRFSSAGGLAPTGLAMNGEVEDYAVLIKGVDFGDAADSYDTTFGAGGPTHGITPGAGFHLGACVDTEVNAGSPLDTTGDDVSVGTSTEGTCAVGNDDEDGVAFTSMLVACLSADVEVTASLAGVLDAWVDFDGDGTFNQANERIFNGQAVAAGSNSLSFAIPCALEPGNTTSRFRFSSAGVGGPATDAMDGEVEDYSVFLKAADFGDAPDTYGTSDGAGGPSHGVDPTAPDFFLGACVDTEGDAAPPLDGSGDDVSASGDVDGTCVGNDDEDGVSFDTMVIACQTADLTLTASAAGLLDAWVDFDGNGDFTGGSEQIFASHALAAGTNSRSFAVPCDATAGNTFVRFRFSSTGGLASGGPTMDGEVEDYSVVLKGSDWGDAPDTYGTTAGASGPLHGVDPASSLYLGACVDTEGDAQAPLDASGDDVSASGNVVGTCVGGDDEDGVSFDSMVVACQDADLTITVGAAGRLDGWIDFDRDGTFGGPGEQVFASEVLTVGANSRSVSVPCDAEVGTTYARFRLSSTGGLASGGPSMDGEVEDYALLLKGSDWGDAPDTYGTSMANGGPLHGVDPGSPLALGVCVDVETDAQTPLDSSGDDVNASPDVVGTCVGGDDEDGVSFDTMVIACQQADLTVTATAPGLLDAWLDFAGDGTFAQPGDRIFTAQGLAAGGNGLSFNVPCDATLGTTYVRFRFSSTGIGTPGGPVIDGEVEDYAVTVKGSDLGDLPDSFATSVSAGGAAHGVDPAVPLFLGACVDTETDAGLPLDASGDDVNGGTSIAGSCAVAGDDEDGVSFDSALVACRDADITVTASAPGLLDGWIDFDGSGDFVAPSDRIFTSQPLVVGAQGLTFSIPCDAVPGTTYLRFRFSSTGAAGSAGPVADGEVEDYVRTLDGVDFGDAPDTYDTLFAANGPTHGVDTGSNIYLGNCVDTEVDGQVGSGNANDDDNNVGSSTAGTCSGNDDEDGVVFDTLITACKPASITVTASAAGLLDAWIDYDADGAFVEALDQVFASEPLVAGPNTLNFNVPCTASSGTTFTRFRFSSAGGLSHDGPAVDGEVEDYQISSDEADFGDAPNSYSTDFASGGPLHGLDPALDLYLGACVDSEVDGQPTVAADGDDVGVGITALGTCSGNDDEDGVIFVTEVIACQQADLTVTASDAGRLDAWLDLDGDGTFNGASDHIFTDQALVAGVNNLSFQVPCNATPGDTFARFRFGAIGNLDFTGTTPNGEVEDYALPVFGSDLGDAPDTYLTTFGAAGPSHGVDTAGTLYLGACVDTDGDGQPSVDALGDDANGGTSVAGSCTGNDDEDGVVFDTLPTLCLDTNLTVVAAAAGRLDAWLDLDGDGTFVGPDDQIFMAQPLVAGSNSLVFNVPCDATPGDSYARFRFSSSGALPIGGPAIDGEVEDYAVLVQGFDFGDAPDPQYPTLLASDGARHVVLPTGNPTLGSQVDIEIEGLQSPDHLGDDNDAADDEDGITLSGLYIPNAPGSMIVQTGSTGGFLNAWIDYNQNGSWDDPGEQIATDLALAASSMQDLELVVDAASAVGPTCARFRLSTSTGLAPTGRADDGEVEDYTLEITEENALLGLSKVILDVQRIDPGASYDVTFFLRAENFGNIRIDELQVMSDVSVAFEDAESVTVVSVSSVELSINPDFDGEGDINLLDGSDALDPGDSGEIILVVNVVPGGNPGPYFCSAVITGTSDADTDVMDVSHNGDDPDGNGNGDPSDDDTPTDVLFDLPPIEVPTLGTWGLLLMGLWLATLGGRRLRRRH